jgi:hypothetical protein
MLHPLKTLDSRTAQGILANLTLEMMPDPGVPAVPGGPRVEPELRDKLIHELRIRLRLKRDDNSPKARALIYSALADEIARLALSGVNVKDVKARVGQQGLLSPSLYRLEFEGFHFRRAAEKCGVTQAQVEDAVKRPDAFEHFKPELVGFDPNWAASLFLKAQKRGDEFYQLLVLTKRAGDVLHVVNAWRIYPSDVDLSKASTPLDVLRAFVDVFGEEFALGDSEKKLFLYERVATKMEGEHISFRLDPKVGADPRVIGQGIFQRQDDILEVAVAFQINYNKYAESLQRYGVRVTMETSKENDSVKRQV